MFCSLVHIFLGLYLFVFCGLIFVATFNYFVYIATLSFFCFSIFLPPLVLKAFDKQIKFDDICLKKLFFLISLCLISCLCWLFILSVFLIHMLILLLATFVERVFLMVYVGNSCVS